MKKFKALSPWIECGLVAIAALSRLLPHAPNFTAIGAIALFAGYYFRSGRSAFVISIAAMILTDLFIGTHPTLVWVYGAFALIAVLGAALSTNRFTWFKTGVTSLTAAGVFFVVTNFGVWVSAGLYPHTRMGLARCFAAAIPFFGNTLVAQFVFGLPLFALHRFLARQSALEAQGPTPVGKIA
ncbi:MAG: DUF6580 family putative transport protein [Bdellovibrionota bacterium]